MLLSLSQSNLPLFIIIQPAVKKYEHSISPQKPLETASYQIINAKFDNAVAGLLDGNDGTPLTGNFKHDVTKGTVRASQNLQHY